MQPIHIRNADSLHDRPMLRRLRSVRQVCPVYDSNRVQDKTGERRNENYIGLIHRAAAAK